MKTFFPHREASIEAGIAQDCPLRKPDQSEGALGLAYVVAGAGFACLLGWELLVVFSPASFLLAQRPFEEAVLLRLVSIAAMAATLRICGAFADWIYLHKARFLFFGATCAIASIALTAADFLLGFPLAASIPVWVAFGFAQTSVMISYCQFFSTMPTKRTAFTIACASCAGTLVFFFVYLSWLPFIGLAAMSVLVLGSTGLMLYLFKNCGVSRSLDVREYRNPNALSLPSMLSVGIHGVIFGYVSILLCRMGLVAAVIGGVSGLVGSMLPLLWVRIGSRVEVDTSLVQRVSLPALVCGLLLFDFLDSAGQLFCCCIVVAALAHSTIMSWTITSIENAEFQLHPVARFVQRQSPNHAGFLIGAILAFVVVFLFADDPLMLPLTSTVLAIAAVAVFCIYGGDESKAKRRLADLLTNRHDNGTHPAMGVLERLACPDQDLCNQTERPGIPDGTGGADDPKGTKLPDDHPGEDEKTGGLMRFKARCEAIAAEYHLTSRESDVFMLLAKGRTAEYISNQLFVSSATVKSHIYHIYQKLGVNSQQSLLNIVDAHDDRSKHHESCCR
ncbi:MAG: helix-turn-helix transcriptional regulator [Coriobacteriaceae bacterium]|nr:helix-turn-helix transcriptional regulator [Coriobacteriaceae bacterium]